MTNRTGTRPTRLRPDIYATATLIFSCFIVVGCQPKGGDDAPRDTLRTATESPGRFTVVYEVDPAISTAEVILPNRLGGARTTVTLAGRIGMEFDTTAGTRTARYTSLALTAPSRTLVARWQGHEERVETGDVRIGLAGGDSLFGAIDPTTRTYRLSGQITLETPALAKYGIQTIPLRTNVSGVLTDGMVYERGASVVPMGLAGGMIALASRSGAKTPAPAPVAPPPCNVTISGLRIIGVTGQEQYAATGTPAGGTYSWSVSPAANATIPGAATGQNVLVKGIARSGLGGVEIKVTYTCPIPPGGTVTKTYDVTVSP